VSCGSANNPNFFTRVSEYGDWIKGELNAYWTNTAPPPAPSLYIPPPGGDTGGDTGGGSGDSGGDVPTPTPTSGASSAFVDGAARSSALAVLVAAIISAAFL
jgi:hypothetical protein